MPTIHRWSARLALLSLLAAALLTPRWEASVAAATELAAFEQSELVAGSKAEHTFGRESS